MWQEGAGWGGHPLQLHVPGAENGYPRCYDNGHPYCPDVLYSPPGQWQAAPPVRWGAPSPEAYATSPGQWSASPNPYSPRPPETWRQNLSQSVEDWRSLRFMSPPGTRMANVQAEMARPSTSPAAVGGGRQPMRGTGERLQVGRQQSSRDLTIGTNRRPRMKAGGSALITKDGQKEDPGQLPNDPFGMEGQKDEVTKEGTRKLKERRQAFEAAQASASKAEQLVDQALSSPSISPPLHSLMSSFRASQCSDPTKFTREAVTASWGHSDSERKVLTELLLGLLDCGTLKTPAMYKAFLDIAEKLGGGEDLAPPLEGGVNLQPSEAAFQTGELLTRIFMGYKGPGPALVEMMFAKIQSVDIRREIVAGVFRAVLTKSRKRLAKVHYAQNPGVARWWPWLSVGGEVSFEDWLDKSLNLTLEEVLPAGAKCPGGRKLTVGEARKLAAAAAVVADSARKAQAGGLASKLSKLALKSPPLSPTNYPPRGGEVLSPSVKGTDVSSPSVRNKHTPRGRVSYIVDDSPRSPPQWGPEMNPPKWGPEVVSPAGYSNRGRGCGRVSYIVDDSPLSPNPNLTSPRNGNPNWAPNSPNPTAYSPNPLSNPYPYPHSPDAIMSPSGENPWGVQSQSFFSTDVSCKASKAFPYCGEVLESGCSVVADRGPIGNPGVGVKYSEEGMRTSASQVLMTTASAYSGQQCQWLAEVAAWQ